MLGVLWEIVNLGKVWEKWSCGGSREGDPAGGTLGGDGRCVKYKPFKATLSVGKIRFIYIYVHFSFLYLFSSWFVFNFLLKDHPKINKNMCFPYFSPGRELLLTLEMGGGQIPKSQKTRTQTKDFLITIFISYYILDYIFLCFFVYFI